MRIVTGVAAVLSLSLAAGASAQQPPQPPPSGGFDTGRCHGRSAKQRNGRLIVRKRGDKVGLHSVKPDGTGLRRLTTPPRGFEDDYAAASPDGRHISFMRGRFAGGGPRVVRVMALDLSTRRAREILPEARDGFHSRKTRVSFFAPTWSPDGRWIAVSDAELPGTVLVHPDGTGAKALDTGPWRLNQISWSPNGRCVVGQISFKPDTDSMFLPSAFGIVGADGGRPNVFIPRCPVQRDCTRNDETKVTRWTRDGRNLIDALAVGDAQTGRIDDRHIVLRSLSGGGSRILGRHLAYPVVSPDGRFITGDNGNGTTMLTIKGKRVRRLRNFGVMDWAPQPR